MSQTEDGSSPENDRAYQWCLHELSQQFPDYAKAQVYATLSLTETLREISDRLAGINRALVVATRHR